MKGCIFLTFSFFLSGNDSWILTKKESGVFRCLVSVKFCVDLNKNLDRVETCFIGYWITAGRRYALYWEHTSQMHKFTLLLCCCNNQGCFLKHFCWILNIVFNKSDLLNVILWVSHHNKCKVPLFSKIKKQIYWLKNVINGVRLPWCYTHTFLSYLLIQTFLLTADFTSPEPLWGTGDL